MTPVQVSSPAVEDLAGAIRWYDARRPGLGAEFYDAIARTIKLIQAHPEIGRVRPGRIAVRQFSVSGFPYKVVYRPRTDDILVVAFAHTSRQPGFWKGRL